MSIPLEDENDTVVITGDVINETPAEPTDVTVVVEAEPVEDSAVDAVVIETEIDLAQRVAVLEERVARVEGQAAMAELDAEIALDIAQEAQAEDAAIIEAVEETIDEVVDADAEDEIEPDDVTPVSAKVHPLFRSMADWKNK